MSTQYERELLVSELQAIVRKHEENRDPFTTVEPIIDELKEVLKKWVAIKIIT